MYLTSVRFAQSHFLSDVRLALGYTAVAIAAATFYLDHRLGWEATKAATLWAVLVYFGINGALTVWIWAVEAGTIFCGSHSGTEVCDTPSRSFNIWRAGANAEAHVVQIKISSRVEKHSPIYRLSVSTRARGAPWTAREISAPFTSWFDDDGRFVALPFQQFLASSVPVIGMADPGKARGIAGVEDAAATIAAAEASGANRAGTSKPRKR